MKKKIAIMILAGVMTLNVCACGQKNANSDNTTEVSSEAKSDVEDKDSSKEEKVSDRADYVSMEEINITEYVKLPDYENMTIEVNKPLVSDAQIEEYIDGIIDIIGESHNVQMYYQNEILRQILFNKNELTSEQMRELIYSYGNSPNKITFP